VSSWEVNLKLTRIFRRRRKPNSHILGTVGIHTPTVFSKTAEKTQIQRQMVDLNPTIYLKVFKSKSLLMRDLRFSKRWRFKSRFSELWRRIVLRLHTNVSKGNTASIFRIKVKMVAVRSSSITWCRSPDQQINTLHPKKVEPKMPLLLHTNTVRRHFFRMYNYNRQQAVQIIKWSLWIKSRRL